MNIKMAVGDVNSKDMGTGARANGDKPRWELMPLIQVASIIDHEKIIEFYVRRFAKKDNPGSMVGPSDPNAFMIGSVGAFQQGHLPVKELLYTAVAYNWWHQCHANKSAITLLDSLVNVIRVWEYGLIKYSEFNWATGMNWNIPIACMVRHAKYHFEDSMFDDESGEFHSAHVVCNAMMLVHYDEFWKEGDDRPLFAFLNKKG